MTEPKIILDQDGIRRALTRIAFEIVEKNKGAEHLLLAGVKTRGIYLAQRIAAKLGEVEGTAPPVLELDVTPWRDDVPRMDAPLPDRELPLRPDYIGKNLPTARDERVFVRLTEVDGEDSVNIQARNP